MLRLKLPGTWKHVPSRDGYKFVVVWFSFGYILLDSEYHTDLEQMLKKIAKISLKMDTICWKLLVK